MQPASHSYDLRRKSSTPFAATEAQDDAAVPSECGALPNVVKRSKRGCRSSATVAHRKGIHS